MQQLSTAAHLEKPWQRAAASRAAPRRILCRPPPARLDRHWFKASAGQTHTSGRLSLQPRRVSHSSPQLLFAGALAVSAA